MLLSLLLFAASHGPPPMIHSWPVISTTRTATAVGDHWHCHRCLFPLPSLMRGSGQGRVRVSGLDSRCPLHCVVCHHQRHVAIALTTYSLSPSRSSVARVHGFRVSCLEFSISHQPASRCRLCRSPSTSSPLLALPFARGPWLGLGFVWVRTRETGARERVEGLRFARVNGQVKATLFYDFLFPLFY